jgi:hypothetical protein
MLDLVPCSRGLVPMKQVVASDHEHFISSMFSATLSNLLAITTLAFLASVRTMVQRKVMTWLNCLRTVFVHNSLLHSLSHGHLELLLYQDI